jgi:hypothetical protein
MDNQKENAGLQEKSAWLWCQLRQGKRGTMGFK